MSGRIWRLQLGFLRSVSVVEDVVSAVFLIEPRREQFVCCCTLTIVSSRGVGAVRSIPIAYICFSCLHTEVDMMPRLAHRRLFWTKSGNIQSLGKNSETLVDSFSENF